MRNQRSEDAFRERETTIMSSPKRVPAGEEQKDQPSPNDHARTQVPEASETGESLDVLASPGLVGTLFLDDRMHVDRFTPGLERTFELKISDIGRPLDEVADDLGMPELYQYAHTSRRTGDNISHSVRDRKERLFLIRTDPYRETRGRPPGVSVSFFDGRRKAAEEKGERLTPPQTHRAFSLLESQARFKTLFESAPDAIYVFDRHGYVLDANSGARRLNGADIDQIEGIHISRFVPKSHQHAIWHDFQRFLEGADAPMLSYDWIDKDKVIPVEIRVTRITYRSAPSVVVFVRNISERRKLERELLRISERERRRIGQDLHDRLASKLSGAIMLGRGLLNRLEKTGSVDKETLADLVEIIRESTREARLLSKGLMPVRPEEEGLADALRELCQRKRAIFAGELKLDIPEPTQRVSPEVADQVYLIGNEALHNALKYAEADQIVVALFGKEEELHLEVRDNGIGFRVDEQQTEGSGLSIMRHRAGILAGELSVDSKPGSGTTVTCRIPLRMTHENTD